MDYTTLGRTGMRVSVMGLGCGGHSRLGQSYGLTESQSAQVVRAAFDHGITFFDTAEGYDTEAILGAGLRGIPRERVVISTKMSPVLDGRVAPREHVREALEASLSRLKMEYVDVYLLHGLSARHYDEAHRQLVPELIKLRGEGKVRAIGVTEAFVSDPGHVMLQRAMHDDCWEVIMVGFNLLNQSARDRVLSTAQQKDIGTLNMFAVRRALSDPAVLSEVISDLGRRGLVDEQAARDALEAVVSDGAASSLQDAAYRFCRHEPGLDVVLSGTGNAAHLASNVASITGRPLPEEHVARLREVFSRVDDVSGN